MRRCSAFKLITLLRKDYNTRCITVYAVRSLITVIDSRTELLIPGAVYIYPTCHCHVAHYEENLVEVSSGPLSSNPPVLAILAVVDPRTSGAFLRRPAKTWSTLNCKWPRTSNAIVMSVTA